MKEEQKEEESGQVSSSKDPSDQMAFDGISEKELQRDLVNLHLPEIDLIGDGDFEARRKDLIAKYGQEWYDEMIGDDVEEEEEGPEEG